VDDPDPLRGVCLDRSLELAGICLRYRDWPGHGGPVVHLPDPLAPSPPAAPSPLIASLAADIAPRYRVLSLAPRPDLPYQADALDLANFLDAFGFDHPVLLAEGTSCVAALVVATWHPRLVAGLVLVSPQSQPAEAGLRGRGLRECPPDLATLRAALTIPEVDLPDLERFLESLDAPR
jgi:pimeloyl-ACP methyl ester carboxylesterase